MFTYQKTHRDIYHPEQNQAFCSRSRTPKSACRLPPPSHSLPNIVFPALLPLPVVCAGTGASWLVPSVVTASASSSSPSPTASPGTVLGLPYRVRPNSDVDVDSEHAVAAEGVSKTVEQSVGSADGIVPVEPVADCEIAEPPSSAGASADSVVVASATLAWSPPRATAVLVTLPPCPVVAASSVHTAWVWRVNIRRRKR